MKRIGILLTAGPGGGTFQYTQTLLDAALALPRDQYKLVAAYVDPLWLGELPADVERFQLRDSAWDRALNKAWHFTRLPMSAWRKTAARLDSNIRALMAQDCDLWLCPGNERYAFRAPVPALGTVHDLMHRYESSFREVSDDGEYERREFHFKETCQWAKAVVVDSELGKRQLHESYGISLDRVFVLPYIAPRYVRETSKTDATFDSRYRLPEKFFFYPAQFYSHKNHRGLVEAIAMMKDSHPDVRLVLVGAIERNGYEGLRGLIAERGVTEHIQFLGYVPDSDMPGLYKRARALVMPTFFGPTNIPPLEAFAAGAPAATSDIYAVRDQLGDAALLFDPRSTEQIRNALVQLWTDDALCADLVARGRKHAENWGQPQFNARLAEIVGMLT